MKLASNKIFQKGNKQQRDGGNQNQGIQNNNPINEDEIDQFDFDTNIGFIKFDDFLNKQSIIQEKIIKCKNCECFLNYFSRLDGENVWKCEFCGTDNQLKINPEYLKPQQKEQDILYMIENVKLLKKEEEQVQDEKERVKKEQEEKKKKNENDVILFCLDNSGSMDITDSSGKSRKQLMVMAIDKQMQKFKDQQINKRVGMVSFGSNVDVIGDNSKQSICVTNVNDENAIHQKCVQKLENVMDLNKGVYESHQGLINRVKNESTQGATALGPGMQACYSLLESRPPGSQIILCTDGEANTGIGSLYSYDSNSAEIFYTSLAQKLQEKGIQVSIITVQGNSSKVDQISVLADLTGGNICRVSLQNMDAELEGILADRMISKSADLQIQLSKELVFKKIQEQQGQLNQERNKFIKKILNPSVYTQVSFEYQVKDEAQQEKIKKAYFQCFVKYQFQDQILQRVITQEKEITEKREEAEKEADLEMLNQRIQQRVGEYSVQQNYLQAEKFGKITSKFMMANCNFNQNLEQVQYNMDMYQQTKQMRMANKMQDKKSKGSAIDGVFRSKANKRSNNMVNNLCTAAAPQKKKSDGFFKGIMNFFTSNKDKQSEQQSMPPAIDNRQVQNQQIGMANMQIQSRQMKFQEDNMYDQDDECDMRQGSLQRNDSICLSDEEQMDQLSDDGAQAKIFQAQKCKKI